MTSSHRVTIDGQTIVAQRGELLLDAALRNGISLPHLCRAGHCGTCRVRLTAGRVEGGASAERGVVHACQCRIDGDAVVESGRMPDVRVVRGVVSSLRPLSRGVMEVGVLTERALPHHAGQYAQVRFAGYPARPFSMTLPLSVRGDGASIWFHVRRLNGGRVTPALGTRIRAGHPVEIEGPYGAAHFRPHTGRRIVLVGTSTGFAPIWSVAVAAMRESLERPIVVIAGGRGIDALYMAPALVQLSRFSNVAVVPFCSAPHMLPPPVRSGRPTDHLPQLSPEDAVYACGAAAMVEAVKAVAAARGAVCFADPFVATAGQSGGVRDTGGAMRAGARSLQSRLLQATQTG